MFKYECNIKHWLFIILLGCSFNVLGQVAEPSGPAMVAAFKSQLYGACDHPVSGQKIQKLNPNLKADKDLMVLC